MSEYIEVGQPLQFTDPNTPTRVGEIVENVSDIYNIPSPRLGMQVFVKNEKKSFVITSLKSKTIGGVDVPEAAVEAFEPVGAKSFTWNNDTDPSNMNDFVVAGVYDIKGEHTREDDNLPILNTGGGHTFNARLTVLDSSISDSGKDDDKCITQVLSFSNRLGQGEVYIRTGKGSSLYNLTWDKWSTLQRNVNVGQVDNLDNLKDNGIYSGVWTKGSYNAYPLTFVCIVINDYFVGVAPRRISQFVYGLSKFDGSTVYQSRVWDDSKNAWSDWEILNQKKISSMISAEIKKVTDGIDPEKIDSIKDIVAWIDAHGGDVTAIYNAIQQNTVKINAEVNRAINKEQEIGNKLNEEVRRATEAEEEINQNAIAADSLGYNTTTNNIRLEYETLNGKNTGVVTFHAATPEKAGVMSAADKVKLNASIKNVDVSPNTDDVELDFEDNTDRTTHVAFPAATTEKAGVMSAGDKKALDKVLGSNLRVAEIVDNNVYSLPKLRPITFTDDVLLKSDGTTTTNETFSTSDYIQGNGCFIKLYAYEFPKSFTSICLYDGENNFLTSYDLGEGEHFVYIRRELKARISVHKNKKNKCGYCIQSDGVPTSLSSKVGELDTKVLELDTKVLELEEMSANTEEIFRSLEIVDNNVYSLPKLRPITFTDDVLLKSDGTTTTNETFSTSDYIQGNGCFIKLYAYEFPKSFTSICLYDGENNFLTSYDLGEGEHFVYIRRELKARISVHKNKKNKCGYCIQSDGVPTSLSSKVGELDTKVLELDSAIKELKAKDTSKGLKGIKISWFGTSIPRQGYPQLVGNITGATVYNESYGSSGARRGAKNTDFEDDPYRIKGLQWPRPVYGLMMSAIERDEVISNWADYVDTWSGKFEGEEGAPTNAKPQNINDGGHEELKAILRDLCYDVRVARHCGISHEYNRGIDATLCSDGIARPAGFTDMSDIYIIEHGYNDAEGNAFADNAEDYNKIPENPYDVNTAIGSINALIRYIYSHNQNAKVLLVGHYENETPRGIWATNTIEQVAKYWGIPLCKLYDVIGASQRTIPTNGYWNNNNWEKSGFSFTTNGESWTSNNYALLYSMIAGVSVGTIIDGVIVGNNATLLKEKLGITEGNGTAQWMPTRRMMLMQDNLHPASSATKEYWARIISGYIYSLFK